MADHFIAIMVQIWDFVKTFEHGFEIDTDEKHRFFQLMKNFMHSGLKMYKVLNDYDNVKQLDAEYFATNGNFPPYLYCYTCHLLVYIESFHQFFDKNDETISFDILTPEPGCSFVGDKIARPAVLMDWNFNAYETY